MTRTDWLVIAGAVVLIVAVNWWFLAAGVTRGVTKPPRDDGGAA
jgi:hypothetical protein